MLQVVTKLIANWKLNFFIRDVLFPFQNCRLSKKSILENFLVYLESYIENISPIFDELQKHMFTKKTVYSAKIVRYALLLRYTSIQSYRMLLGHFPLPSLSLLHKISSSTIDGAKCAQTLRNEGKISTDVCLMFDEMYLQKCEEYFADDLVGCVTVQVNYVKD